MPRFNNKEEYERWKAERMGKPSQGSLNEPVEQKPAPEPTPPLEKKFDESKLLKVEARQPSMRNLSELFSQSWEIYKNRAGVILAVYFAGIVGAVASLFLLLGLGFLAGLFAPDIKELFIGLGGLFGVVVASVVFIWGLASVMQAIVTEDADIGNSFSAGWSKLWAFMWLYTIFLYILVGGFFLLIIPLFIFSIMFCFAPYILAAEDERGMNALLKSAEYAKGHFWEILGRLLLIQIIGMLGSAIPFVGFIFSIAFFPFGFIFTYLIYWDLREIKGERMAFESGTGRKAAWVGFATAGYVIWPVVLLLVFGFSGIKKSVTDSLQGLLEARNKMEQTIKPEDFPMPPPQQFDNGIMQDGQAPAGNAGSVEAKNVAVGEAEVVLNGVSEKYALKTGLISDTNFGNPKRASIEFQLPADKHSNSRRIEFTLDATRTGEHHIDGVAISDAMYGRIEESAKDSMEIFQFVADGGRIFPPKDKCTVVITSAYTGTQDGVFSGEIKDCKVSSSGVDKTITASFTMRGVPWRE